MLEGLRNRTKEISENASLLAQIVLWNSLTGRIFYLCRIHWRHSFG